MVARVFIISDNACYMPTHLILFHFITQVRPAPAVMNLRLQRFEWQTTLGGPADSLRTAKFNRY